MSKEVIRLDYWVMGAEFYLGKFLGVFTILGADIECSGDCMCVDVWFAVTFLNSQVSDIVKLCLSGLLFLWMMRSGLVDRTLEARAATDQSA